MEITSNDQRSFMEVIYKLGGGIAPPTHGDVHSD